jgi:glutaredoxin 2
MERVGTLINKLKEQFDQQAGTDKLLVTTQLLIAALQRMQTTQPSPKGTISVVMPWTNKQTEPISSEKTAEINIPTALTEQTQKVSEKKEEKTGWLFDPLVSIPTLARQDQKEVFELNDVLLSEESLNDKLKEEKVEVATMLHGTIVRDLKKAIGFNDRHLFINELFRGDEDMFERSIKTINGFSIYPEAEYWIQRELKVKIGWNEQSDAVKQFDQLVKRRFS